VLKKSIAVASAVVIVGVAAVVGVAQLTSSRPASAQIGTSETIYMTTTQYGTNTILNWGPGTTLGGNGCSTILSHASQVQSVQGGMQQTLSIGGATGGAGAGKVAFSPLVISKLIDAGSTPFERALAAGVPFNVQLYFFHPQGSAGIDCTKPDMKINLVLAAGSGENFQVAGGGSETITLQFGLEAVRTASVNSVGTWSWDANGGFCWDRVKNISCSAASVPLTA
jgi:Type VI secretion system effector, Hcp